MPRGRSILEGKIERFWTYCGAGPGGRGGLLVAFRGFPGPWPDSQQVPRAPGTVLASLQSGLVGLQPGPPSTIIHRRRGRSSRRMCLVPAELFGLLGPDAIPCQGSSPGRGSAQPPVLPAEGRPQHRPGKVLRLWGLQQDGDPEALCAWSDCH